MSKVEQALGEQQPVVEADFEQTHKYPDYKHLVELYNNLKVKYEREISARVQDKGKWESLTMSIQRLQVQKAQLQLSRNTLIQQLNMSQKRRDHKRVFTVKDGNEAE